MAIAFGAVIGEAHTGGNSASKAFTTTATVPSGAKIIVSVGWYNNVTLSSVSGGSLTWTVDKTQNGSDTLLRTGVASADAPSGLASGTTLTANFGGGNADASTVAGYYITGAGTGAGSVDAVGGAGGAGTSATANVITTNADDLIAQSLHVDLLAGDITPAASMNEAYDLANGDGPKFEVAYRVVSSTGTYAVGGSWTGSKNWTVAGVAYKAAAAAAFRNPRRSRSALTFRGR